MFSLSLYNSSLKSQWDNFINESKNGTFLFNRDFIEYHKNRFKDYSILFYKLDKLIAVFPANIFLIENEQAQIALNIDKNIAIIRAPFQLLFIAIAYWHSR